MSLQAITTVSNHMPLPAPLAGFLFTLANIHNAQTDTCNPSNATLCELLQTSRPTVQRWFRQAEALGVITREGRFVKGRQVASNTTFNTKEGASLMKPRGVTDETVGGITDDIQGGCNRGITDEAPGGLTGDIQKQEINKQTDLHAQPPAAARDDIAEKQFQIFWANYPKRVDRKRAEKAFRNLTKAKQQKAIDDCGKRYANTQRRYVPNATTYLHGERWEDELPDGTDTPSLADYAKGGI